MPLALVRHDVASYRWKRFIQMDKLVPRPVWPRRGIMAGAVGAIYQLRAYVYRIIKRHCLHHMSVTLLIHIDDISFSAASSNVVDLAADIAHTSGLLATQIQDDWRLPLARDKMFVVADDERTLRAVRARVGPLAGTPTSVVKKLGDENQRCLLEAEYEPNDAAFITVPVDLRETP